MSPKETFRAGYGDEERYGYVQAVKAGDTLYLSGQVARDATGGEPVGLDVGTQLRQAYANARTVLAHFGVGPEAVVDELLLVVGLADVWSSLVDVRKEFYGPTPDVASTLFEVPRLGSPHFLAEVKLIAKL